MMISRPTTSKPPFLLRFLFLSLPITCITQVSATKNIRPYGYQSNHPTTVSSDTIPGSMSYDIRNDLLYIVGRIDSPLPLPSSSSSNNNNNDDVDEKRKNVRNKCFLTVLQLPQPHDDDDYEYNYPTTTTTTTTTTNPTPKVLYTRTFISNNRTSHQTCTTISAVPDMDHDGGVRLLLGGHTTEHGLLTRLREKGSDKSSVYGTLIDFGAVFQRGQDEEEEKMMEEIIEDAEMAEFVEEEEEEEEKNKKKNDEELLGGHLFHSSKRQYPTSMDIYKRSFGRYAPWDAPSGSPKDVSIFIGLMETDDDDDHDVDPMQISTPTHHFSSSSNGSQKTFTARIQKLGWADPNDLKSRTRIPGPNQGETIRDTMKVHWSREYAPVTRGDSVHLASVVYLERGGVDKDDVLLMAGTTSGLGVPFAKNGGENVGDDQEEGGDDEETVKSRRRDLDGFVTKLDPLTGNVLSNLNDNDNNNNSSNPETSGTRPQIQPATSLRISSVEGYDDIIADVCYQPETNSINHIYVVGSTKYWLDYALSTTNQNLQPPSVEQVQGRKEWHAYVMKVDLDTMKPVWVRQINSYASSNQEEEEEEKHDVEAYGCAITPDGSTIYTTGIIRNNGIIQQEQQSTTSTSPPPSPPTGGGGGGGGDDLFISSLDTTTGSFHYTKQIGTKYYDSPSDYGHGSVIADARGNALILGQTKGSLVRAKKQQHHHHRHHSNNKDTTTTTTTPSDVFVIMVKKDTGDIIKIAEHWGENENEHNTILGCDGVGCPGSDDGTTKGSGDPDPEEDEEEEEEGQEGEKEPYLTSNNNNNKIGRDTHRYEGNGLMILVLCAFLAPCICFGGYLIVRYFVWNQDDITPYLSRAEKNKMKKKNKKISDKESRRREGRDYPPEQISIISTKEVSKFIDDFNDSDLGDQPDVIMTSSATGGLHGTYEFDPMGNVRKVPGKRPVVVVGDGDFDVDNKTQRTHSASTGISSKRMSFLVSDDEDDHVVEGGFQEDGFQEDGFQDDRFDEEEGGFVVNPVDEDGTSSPQVVGTNVIEGGLMLRHSMTDYNQRRHFSLSFRDRSSRSLNAVDVLHSNNNSNNNTDPTDTPSDANNNSHPSGITSNVRGVYDFDPMASNVGRGGSPTSTFQYGHHSCNDLEGDLLHFSSITQHKEQPEQEQGIHTSPRRGSMPYRYTSATSSINDTTNNSSNIPPTATDNYVPQRHEFRSRSSRSLGDDAVLLSVPQLQPQERQPQQQQQHHHQPQHHQQQQQRRLSRRTSVSSCPATSTTTTTTTGAATATTAPPIHAFRRISVPEEEMDGSSLESNFVIDDDEML